MTASDKAGLAAGEDTGGFIVTHDGNRLVAVWRPPRGARIGLTLFTVAAWVLIPLQLMLESKRTHFTTSTGQIDWFYLAMLCGSGLCLGLPMTCIAIPKVRLRLRVEISDDELAITSRTWRTIHARWPRAELVHVQSDAGYFKRLLVLGRQQTYNSPPLSDRAVEWLQATLRARYGMGDRPEPAWLQPGRGVIPPAEFARPASGAAALPGAEGLVFDLPRIATPEMRRATVRGLRDTLIRLLITIALLAGCFWALSVVPLPNPAGAAKIQVFLTGMTVWGMGTLGVPAFLACLGAYARQESIVVAEDALISTVRHGLFRLRRVRRLEALRRLTVRSVSTGEDASLGMDGQTLARLDADFEGQPRLCLAHEHPRTQLVELAKAIAYEARRRRAMVTLIDHPHRAATAGDMKTWTAAMSLTVLESGPSTRVQASLTDQSLPRVLGLLGVMLTFTLAAAAGGAVWLWHYPAFDEALVVGGCILGATLVGGLLVRCDRWLMGTRPGAVVLTADGVVWTPGGRIRKPKRWKLDEVAGFVVTMRKDSDNRRVVWQVDLLQRAGSSETLLAARVAEQAREAVDALSAALAHHTGVAPPGTPAVPKLDWMSFAANVAPKPPKPWKLRNEATEGGVRLYTTALRDLGAVLVFLGWLFGMAAFAGGIGAIADAGQPMVVKIGVGSILALGGFAWFMYGIAGFLFAVLPRGEIIATDTTLIMPEDFGKRTGVTWHDLESVAIRRGAKKDIIGRVTCTGLVIIKHSWPAELWARLRDGSEVKLAGNDEPARLEWLKATIDAAAAWRRQRIDAEPSLNEPRP